MFSSINRGCFFLQWSYEEVEEALAAFVPRKPVPQHKLAAGGKHELCRDAGGPHSKRFYEGWTMFIKEAAKYDGSLLFLSNLPPKPVAIYFLDAAKKVRSLPVNLNLSTAGVVLSDQLVLAVAPALTAEFPVGANFDARIFEQIGDRVGAAIAFDGGGEGVGKGVSNVHTLKD